MENIASVDAFGNVVLDARQWVANRSGGKVDDLSDLFQAFTEEFHARQRNYWPSLSITDLLAAFIVARSGDSDWRDGEFPGGVTESPEHAPLDDRVTLYGFEDGVHGFVLAVGLSSNQYESADSFEFHELAGNDTDWAEFDSYTVTCRVNGDHQWRRSGGEWTFARELVSDPWPKGLTVDEDEVPVGTIVPDGTDDVILCQVPSCRGTCEVTAE